MFPLGSYRNGGEGLPRDGTEAAARRGSWQTRRLLAILREANLPPASVAQRLDEGRSVPDSGPEISQPPASNPPCPEKSQAPPLASGVRERRGLPCGCCRKQRRIPVSEVSSIQATPDGGQGPPLVGANPGPPQDEMQSDASSFFSRGLFSAKQMLQATLRPG